jgi:hypothetical protein
MRWPLVAACVLGLSAVASAQGDAAAPAKPTIEASRLDSYKKDGATYFALSLQPAANAAPAADAHHIVVLFDTSASQTGRYREKSLEVLRSFLADWVPKTACNCWPSICTPCR